jgi:predicted TPR repeat methyltransferase
MKRKQFIKAAEDLNRSTELNASYLKSYVKRAEVNMERGEYSAAISDYGRIQELDPSVNLGEKIKIAKKK